MTKYRNAYCSFCRKSYTEVGPLVEGPDDVFICGKCIELCQSIIDQEKHRRGVPQTSVPEKTFRLDGHDWQVNSREDFICFVYALMADLHRKPQEWEHAELPRYLRALAAWVSDMNGYYRDPGQPVPDPPSWQSLAEMLMAARVYE
jgi:hypothetical protein